MRELSQWYNTGSVIHTLSSLLFYRFRYIVQPPTCDAHLFELRCARCKVRSLRMLPTFAAMPQVQAPYACTMLCEINYGKYLRGETRFFCVNCLNVSGITLEQTNSFPCTTNFSICRAELRCEEVAISKAEVKSRIRGKTRRT